MRHEAETETFLSEQKLGLLDRVFLCKASLYTAHASLELGNNERALTTLCKASPLHRSTALSLSLFLSQVQLQREQGQVH